MNGENSMTKYDEYTAEDKMLEAGRERDHKKKNKYGIPDEIIIFSVNDLT